MREFGRMKRILLRREMPGRQLTMSAVLDQSLIEILDTTLCPE